jgi:peptidoglycan/xylan/chitin deacetylase (PgdA/CDA1 family)
VNRALKRLAERALIVSGLARYALRRRRAHRLVLAYHDVIPHGDTASGDASLHLSQHEFARQLDALAQSHEVVPITALFDAPRYSSRPRVVITFDDAYLGALTAGVHELGKRGLPATIFVSPGILASVPWWDLLAEPAQGVVPEELRTHALDVLSGKTDLVLASAPSKSARSGSMLKLPRIGTDAELSTAVSKSGISLGSHSWSHPNLCKLDESELQEELDRPLAWLRSRFASVVPWLSYPYGIQSERVQRAAEKAGYVGAFRIDGGWIPPRSYLPSYSLPRLNIPAGLSLDGFRLRIAGL